MTERAKKAADTIVDKELQQAVQLLQDDTYDFESINPALESLYAEMGLSDGGDATVHVSKLDADGRGAEAQVWKGDPEQYDLEMLAKKFGSGSYRVRVYVKIPTGQRVMKANKVFAWLLSAEDEDKRNRTPVAQIAPPPQDIGKTVADAVATAIAALNANRPAPVDPMQQLASLASIMQTLQPQVSHQPVPQPADPFAMMRGMIEMMNMMKGDEPIVPVANAGTSDVLLGLVNKFGPLLMQTMAQQQGQPQMLPAPQQYAPNPQPLTTNVTNAEPVLAPPPPPQYTQTQEDEMNLKLKMGIAWLIGQCDGGGAPDTYAEVVLDSVPAESLQVILSQPDPVAFFISIDPRAANEPYKQWFTDLLAAVRDMLTPETEQQNSLDNTSPQG